MISGDRPGVNNWWGLSKNETPFMKVFNELSLNTFINGVSFFDNPHQLFTPGLSPDIIQSVNIITGGFPAEFGNRFGGILDIVTRTGFDANNHGSVTIGVGNYLRDNAS